MNYTMKPVTAKGHHCQQPLIASSLHHHCPFFFSKPVSSVSFRTRPDSSSSYPFTPIKASSFSNYSGGSSNKNVNPNNLFDKYRKIPQFPAAFLKTTLVATTAAAALLFFRFNLLAVKPVIAAPFAPTVETMPELDKEKSLEDQLMNNANDVEALKNLMEVRIMNQKPREAIRILDKLIELEPNENEWPLMKSHLHIYTEEIELAKKGFNEIIAKDPFQVGAYHGLVMALSQDDETVVATDELKGIEKRILEAMNLCKKQNKKTDLRDFKLLQAQIRVIEGNYNEALKVYDELVKEEPSDFRPYLCQGIIYTLLRKKGEAEENFEKYRRLVPKNHPYGKYFEDNMFATKAFGQNVEKESAGSTS